MKVALVCDWLTEVGGAEKVLMEFHKLFPNAPIYTSQYRKGRIDWFKDADVKTGYLQYFPVWSRRLIAPLRQKYFKNLDLSEYDLVISITGCDAKFVKTTNTHLCYCHVPTQYYWGKYDEYLKNPGFGVLNPLARAIFKKISPKLREEDLKASKNPTKYITISDFAKKEIKRFYNREAKVINPPVNMDIFAQVVDNLNMKKGKSQTKKSYNKTTKMQICQGDKNEQKFCTYLKNVENLDILAQIIAKYPNGFYLNFSRQVNWKRLDLVVNCCKNNKLPLVLIGDGPENCRLKRLAKKCDNITFIDSLPQSDLAIFASLAKAFIFPSEEPFGIAPVEAMSAGCPVIAYKGGGALEYIKDGKNGVFFEKQTEKSLEKILKKFEKGRISLDSPKKISASVKKYASSEFKKKIKSECQKSSASIKRRATLKSPLCEQKNTSKIAAFLRGMIISLPLILFFSFFPNLNFGENSSMHFFLTFPLLWLALFSVLNLKTAYNYLKNHRKTPLLAFLIYLIISFFTSTNPIRAFFTISVLFCILVSVIGLNEYLKTEKLPRKFKKIIITETAIVCIFCLLQSLFDALGASKDLTLICETCRSDIFGFPHPNGFAIEPQFMGSLLIAPTILAFNSLLENKNKKCQVKLTIITLLIISTIFVTLSRGAILSLIIAEIFLIFVLKDLRKALKIIFITIASLVFALILQGTLAVLGPTKTSFTDAISTSLSQLSFGKINLNKKDTLNGEFDEPSIDIQTSEIIQPESEAPIFSGYIEESTNRRLELSFFALKISTKTPTNTIFGTGLGSAGTEMYVNFPIQQGHEKEIVQNQYFETLLEIGVIGIIMLFLTIKTFIKLEEFKFEPYTVALILAFMVSILFFSGFKNALHIYLLPVIWYNLMYDKDRFSRI